MQKKRWIGELQELRAIFRDCLPMGEDSHKAEEYFNSLEKVIFTNDYKANPDPLRREEFDSYDPDVEYSYLSDVIFKERSSHRELRAHRQIVDDQSDVHARQVPQLGGPVSSASESIPERSESSDSEDGWRDYSGHTSGKLQSGSDC
jgi:hypothetical protein